MSENILKKIIKKKIEKMANLKKTISSDSLNQLLKSNKMFINFKENCPARQDGYLNLAYNSEL